ncbi:hypothetical protein [Paraburkholderia sp. UYCP14C]|uniref:hypothetical protein n=1 Tax=Paraburkholderia sp. UYCP14C TaxID=2511130 RepID=UPI001B7D75E6|nr:hypothetical protein [Paraburkholderia sp. UYCP14C]
MAYRTLSPFTEQTIQEFADHTNGEVEAALAKADALSLELVKGQHRAAARRSRQAGVAFDRK